MAIHIPCSTSWMLRGWSSPSAGGLKVRKTSTRATNAAAEEKNGTVSTPIWIRMGATMVLPVKEPMLTTM